MHGSDSIHGLDAEDPDSLLEPADVEIWDTEVEVSCPYCSEVVTIGVDPAGGAVQTYVEDCQVCCRPWLVHLSYDDHGGAHGRSPGQIMEIERGDGLPFISNVFPQPIVLIGEGPSAGTVHIYTRLQLVINNNGVTTVERVDFSAHCQGQG